jgi:hypothetical protein
MVKFGDNNENQRPEAKWADAARKHVTHSDLLKLAKRRLLCLPIVLHSW